MSESFSNKERKQNNLSTRNSLKSLKFKTNRVLVANSPNSTSLYFDDRQITQQLTLEVAKITQIIEEYKAKIKNMELLPSKEDNIVHEIIHLQQIILSTDDEIKQINQEIKNLKVAKNNSFEKNKTKDDSQSFMLAEELKKERSALRQTISEHENAINKYMRLKNNVAILSNKFREKYAERYISYEEFRENNGEDKREIYTIKKPNAKQTKEIKEKIPPAKEKLDISIQNFMPKENISNKQDPANKSMRQLQNKKEVTKIAIKRGKKKHLAQISQLSAKLQFLRDQNALLNLKIQQTETEMAHIQLKFKSNPRKKFTNNYIRSPSSIKNSNK